MPDTGTGGSAIVDCLVAGTHEMDPVPQERLNDTVLPLDDARRLDSQWLLGGLLSPSPLTKVT